MNRTTPKHLIELNYRHGLSRTKFHNTWRSIKQKCTQSKQVSYAIYGARGIGYDPKWESFDAFKDDMYDSYLQHVAEHGEKNTQIERADVNGNYNKENCRWATIKEQAQNKRSSLMFEFRGEKKCLKAWCEDFGVNYHTIYTRMYTRGLSFENALGIV